MNCDKQTTLAMIACVLLIAFLDVFDRNIPQLERLFTNKVNCMLLAILVVLTVFINVPIGVMLIVVLTYMHFYYMDKQEKRKQHNAEFAKVTMSNAEQKFNSAKASHVAHDDNVKLTNQVAMNNTPEQLKAKVANDVKQVVEKRTNDFNLFNNEGNDMLTQKAPNDKQGFDVAGCRYDMKAGPQNLTKYGPPLSLCSVYSKEHNQAVGSYFYPLNG